MRARKTKKWWRGKKLYNCPPWKYIIFGRTRRCFGWHNSLAFILADIKWQKKKLSFIWLQLLFAVDFHKFANTNLSVSIQVRFLNHGVNLFLWNCLPHALHGASQFLRRYEPIKVLVKDLEDLLGHLDLLPQFVLLSAINLDISALFSNINFRMQGSRLTN